MTLHDLPEDWPSIPLTDPDHIADVLDIFVSLEARHCGALVVIICDEQRRPLQPVQIDDMPACPAADALTLLTHLARVVGEVPGGSALFGIARLRKHRVTANDQAWRHAIETAFDGHAAVLGVHVVTASGSLPVRSPGEAA